MSPRLSTRVVGPTLGNTLRSPVATIMSLNYVGNHGVHQIFLNPSLNAYASRGLPLARWLPVAAGHRDLEGQAARPGSGSHGTTEANTCS